MLMQDDEMKKKMKRQALDDLIKEMKGMESERMGIMPQDDMSSEQEEPIQLAQDFQRPSDQEAQYAIQKMLAEQQAPDQDQTPPDMVQPNTPEQKAEDNMGILEKPFKEGMDEQEKRRKMIDDLFRNRE